MASATTETMFLRICFNPSCPRAEEVSLVIHYQNMDPQKMTTT
jgi:hypothetical protein